MSVTKNYITLRLEFWHTHITWILYIFIYYVSWYLSFYCPTTFTRLWKGSGTALFVMHC